MYSVYVLKSKSTGKCYIGYTSNINARLKSHNSGANISTRANRPWQLVHLEILSDKKSAIIREGEIKSYKGGNAFKKLLNI